MKPSLHYLCPLCATQSTAELKEIDKLIKDKTTNCQSCNGELALNNEGITTLTARCEEIKAAGTYQLWGSLIMVASTLLHFSEVITMPLLIIGYVATAGLYIKSHSTTFPDAMLTFYADDSAHDSNTETADMDLNNENAAKTLNDTP
ncbi:hypothetical protein L4C36_16665 [Photobacterium japonica]|uniref:hypothetical protein n=1 Tax=Photobacterium japonica TaxID=2910235 RepID=UPI003D1143EA